MIQCTVNMFTDDISAFHKTLSFYWKADHQLLEVLEKNYFRFEEEEYNRIYDKIQEIIRDVKILKRRSDLLLDLVKRTEKLYSIISPESYEKCCELFSDMDVYSMKWSEFYSTLNTPVYVA